MRSTSVDSAHSSHAAEAREGQGVWSEKDGRHSATKDSEHDGNEIVRDDIDTGDYQYETNVNLLTLTSFFESSATQWIISSIVLSIVVGTLSHFRFNLAISVALMGIGIFTTRRSVEQLKKDYIWDLERNPGNGETKKARQGGESVEWLNQVIRHVWPVVSPELFVAGVDLFEDALKSLSPAVVHSVKVSSLEQGTNPLRLLGIRYLPSDADITLPPTSTSTSTKPSSTRSHSFPIDSSFGLSNLSHHREGEEPGSYVNLEAEFSFRRLPPSSSSSHSTSTSPHFLLHLGVGLVKKLVKFDVPVWVELVGLHGKCRLRLQITGEPPFVGHVKFCLLQLPAIEIVAKPLSSLSMDIMNFPGVSPFILSSINSVINNFVAPKSYTIEMSRFFLGSDVLMKTKSIGVICLVIHSATRLSPSGDFATSIVPDSSSPPHSSSDTTPSSWASHDDSPRRSVDKSQVNEPKKCHPFINVLFSHVGRILHATRVVENSSHVITRLTKGYESDAEEGGDEEEEEWEFEEMVFVRVSEEDMQDDESLRMVVLDSDRSAVDDSLTVLNHERVSNDDVLGYVDISLQQLRATSGMTEHGNADLRNLHRGVKVGGKVKFSAAFFPLARSTPLVSEPTKTIESDHSALAHLQFPTSSSSHSLPSHFGSLIAEDTKHSSTTEEKREKKEKEKEKEKQKKEKHRPMFTDRAQSEGGSRSAAYAQRMREMLDGRIPANLSQRSGILSYQVHQLADLVSTSVRANGNVTKEKERSKEAALPSSYVRVFINDELVLRTGVKPFSAAPYINMESEYFLRSWLEARIHFVVMDSIEGDHDVVIGGVTLELRELLSKTSQSTRWFPLLGGQGGGRLRLSLLFKPIDITIDPCLRDWNIGSVALTKLSIVGLDHSSTGKLRISVDGCAVETQAVRTTAYETFEAESRNIHQIDFGVVDEKPLRLGVLNRHVSPLVFSFSTLEGPLSTLPVEITSWLALLSEGKDVRVVLPIYERHSAHPPYSRPALPLPSMPVRRSKRHKMPRPFSHHSLSKAPTTATSSSFSHLSDIHDSQSLMGTLSFTIRWTPGLHDVHRETLPDDLADVANLFLLHASTIAAEDRNRVRVRLPEDDGSHDHSSSSTPGGRKSGELSSSSSRRSSMSGLSDEEREHRISFDDGGNRVVKKTKKEKSGHNWIKKMIGKSTKSSKP